MTNASNKSGENKMGQAPSASAQDTAKDRSDRLLDTLQEAVQDVAEADHGKVANASAGDLSTFLAGQLPKVNTPADPCKENDPTIAAFCHQRKLALDTADINFNNAKMSASGAFGTARGAWRQAVSEYEFEIANARADFDAAVTAARAEYDKKKNPDSGSRSQYLFFTLQLAVAEALQALETSAGSASATLSGAAGTLLGAHATYVSAINAAQSQLLIDVATAWQSFWQNVENVWDAT